MESRTRSSTLLVLGPQSHHLKMTQDALEGIPSNAFDDDPFSEMDISSLEVVISKADDMRDA